MRMGIQVQAQGNGGKWMGRRDQWTCVAAPTGVGCWRKGMEGNEGRRGQWA